MIEVGVCLQPLIKGITKWWAQFKRSEIKDICKELTETITRDWYVEMRIVGMSYHLEKHVCDVHI